MPKVKTEVKSRIVNYRCDECKEGFMKVTSICRYSSPLQYQHKCTVCSYVAYFKGVKYPHIEHEIKE